MDPRHKLQLPEHKISNTLSKYYKRLKEGAFLHEILEDSTAEDENYIAEHLVLLKAYEESLSQKKLGEILHSLKLNIPLTQILPQVHPRDLTRVIHYLPQLQVIEEDFNAFKRNTNEGFENSEKSFFGTKKLRFLAEPETLSEQKNEKTQGSPKTSPKLHHSLSFSDPIKEPKKSDLTGFFGPEKEQYSQFRKAKSNLNIEANDPDDNQNITFVDSLNGLTFKEVLHNESNYFGWFRWLKYKHQKATSDQDCVMKAYKYFSKHLSYWNDIPPYPK